MQTFHEGSSSLFTTTEEVRVCSLVESFVFCITSQVFFSKDGSKLYSVGSEKHNNFIVVLCIKTGSVLQTIKPPTGFGRFCLDVSGTKCIIGKPLDLEEHSNPSTGILWKIIFMVGSESYPFRMFQHNLRIFLLFALRSRISLASLACFLSFNNSIWANLCDALPLSPRSEDSDYWTTAM